MKTPGILLILLLVCLQEGDDITLEVFRNGQAMELKGKASGFMNGRHYTFWQELQDTRLFAAWSQARSHVLSMHGKGEYVAFNPYEHQLIADIVNHYNPGKATFMRIPDIDHAFTYVEDLEHSISVRNDREYQLNNFHPGIVDILYEWMEELIKQ